MACRPNVIQHMMDTEPQQRTTASVLVVDDHPVFVVGLTRLLFERGPYDVASSGTAAQALAYVQQEKADVVLVDIALPDKSGLWLIQSIHNVKPELPCLVLSGYSIGLYVQEAIRNGARGYVLKDDVPGILEGIRAVLGGGTYFSEALRNDGK